LLPTCVFWIDFLTTQGGKIHLCGLTVTKSAVYSPVLVASFKSCLEFRRFPGAES